MNMTFLQPTRTAVALAVIAVLAACVSAPAINPRLTEAQSAYDKAVADAQVARSAPVELQQAQQALQKADAALRSGDDASAVDHYAYLARQRTEVAVQAGRIAQADQAVAQSRAQRDRILIDARTRDAEAQRDAADKARMAAEQSRSQADAAREQATLASSQAEEARQLAVERLAAAEEARQLAVERLAAADAAREQASVAKTRASALEAQMAELKARQTDRGMVLTLGDVLFDSGRSTLKAGAMRTVDQLARFLDKNPTRKVLIEGHTDSVGSDSSNLELSLHRAEAVQQALTDRSIAAGRVEVSGLGEGYPVASNDSAAGRQQNRRVEVIFSDDAGSIKARVN